MWRSQCPHPVIYSLFAHEDNSFMSHLLPFSFISFFITFYTKSELKE